jgi:hypothetical protein
MSKSELLAAIKMGQVNLHAVEDSRKQEIKDRISALRTELSSRALQLAEPDNAE